MTQFSFNGAVESADQFQRIRSFRNTRVPTSATASPGTELTPLPPRIVPTLTVMPTFDHTVRNKDLGDERC